MTKIKFVARPILIPIVLISVFVTLLISGCSININNGQTPSPTPTITVSPTPTITIDKTTVLFWLCVTYDKTWGSISDTSGQINDEELQNLVIKVNNIHIPSTVDPLGGRLINKVFDEPLNAGDTLNIDFQHPKLGSYAWSLVMPNPTNLISPPDLATLNAWANGDETAPSLLHLSWAAVDCNYYSIAVERYDSSHSSIGWTSRWTNETSFGLDRDVLQLPDSTYAPCFNIFVQPTNAQNLGSLFKGGSGVYVFPDVEEIKNF